MKICKFYFLFLIFLINALHAYPYKYFPMDHNGGNIVLKQNDLIFGLHTNVKRFEVETSATAEVYEYYAPYFYPGQAYFDGNGTLEVYAEEIIINGALNGKGRGYSGGGGWGGTGGKGDYHHDGQGQGMSQGRYFIFEPDGPAKATSLGGDGGYNIKGDNTDATTNTSVLMGSGAYGGWGGYGGILHAYYGAGGGGGGPGGSCISLRATKSIIVKGLIDTSGTRRTKC